MLTANVFFSLLALATNAAAIGLIGLLVTRRSTWVAGYLRRARSAALPLAAAVAVVSTLGSLYYSEIVGFRPCPLCWYQRGAMYPLAVLLVAAVTLRRPAVWKVGLPLSLFGLLLSGYHYLIQWVPAASMSAVCSVDVPCTAAEVWQLGFISLAYMAGSAFLLIALLLVFAVRPLERSEARLSAAGGRDAGALVTATFAVAGVVAVITGSAPQPPAPDPAGAAVTAPTIEGDPLPLHSVDDDPAVGLPFPGLQGTDYEGDPVVVPAADGRPKIVMVVAHWCPHCQREVPAVQSWVDANGMPEDVDLYAVSTAADATAPEHPPQQWLRAERWTVPTVADDDDGTGAFAMGVSGYPFFVFVGADGLVAGRHAGALGIERLEEVVENLAEVER